MIFFGSKRELISDIKKEIIEDIEGVISNKVNARLSGLDIVSEVSAYQQKFDALADALGIVVASDLDSKNPHAVIASVKNFRKASKAKELLQIIALDKELVKLKAGLVVKLVGELKGEISDE